MTLKQNLVKLMLILNTITCISKEEQCDNSILKTKPRKHNQKKQQKTTQKGFRGEKGQELYVSNVVFVLGVSF